MADGIFLAVPPYFAVDYKRQQTIDGIRKKASVLREAFAGFCVSLHAHAAVDNRYECVAETASQSPIASSVWTADGCSLEYYRVTYADELASALGDGPSRETDVVQHYVARGKQAGLRCSPCLEGKRLGHAAQRLPRALRH